MTETISIDAILLEIENCSNYIKKLEVQRDDVLTKVKNISNRIDVLNAIDNKLSVGATKELNFANINTIADERFKFTAEFNRLEKNINQYTEILNVLINLRDEN